ncbi:sortase-like protein [Corynebacterium kutscheri]|uniref:class E sortase n=1 Tax=Corynebacterium kutscheri TaxID=35755 RepID=UPI000F6ECCB1|nr:class E sortase [Corynebacterium kutscheri]VEH81725.1 sortase-like protein [Corynebacterium kutscheri]
MTEKQHRVSISTVLGELMLTCGLLLFLFAFYEAYWTNIEAGKAQNIVAGKLDEQWKNPRQKINPELGEAFARMYIPRFGSDFQFAIVEGTEDADLLAGPGHYVGTALPGQKGNFAVAGHRVGKGAPFNDLGNLEVCDAVVVETQTQWVVYRVLPIGLSGPERRAAAESCLTLQQAERVAAGEYSTVEGRHITLPGDIGVIDPVPGINLAEPAEGLVTLTTCHPQFSNAERMIVHAMETEVIAKDGVTRPAVLEEN